VCRSSFVQLQCYLFFESLSLLYSNVGVGVFMYVYRSSFVQLHCYLFFGSLNLLYSDLGVKVFVCVGLLHRSLCRIEV